MRRLHVDRVPGAQERVLDPHFVGVRGRDFRKDPGRAGPAARAGRTRSGIPIESLSKIRIARYAREFGWVLAGNAATMVASLLTLKYLTSVLTQAQFGELNLVLTALILPSWLIYAPISQAALRWYAQENENGRLDRLFQVTVMGYLLAGVSVLVLAGFGALLGACERLGVSPAAWYMATFLLIIESFVLLANGFANAARYRKRVAAIGASMVWLRLALAVASGVVAPGSPEVILGAYVLGSALVIVPAWSPLHRALPLRRLDSDDLGLLRRMLAYGLPFGLWSSFAWAQQYIDRYAVDVLMGRGAAGVYIAAIQISAIPFTAIGAVVSQFLTPIVFEVVGNGEDPQRMRRAVSHVMRGSWWLAFTGVFIVAIYFVAGDRLTAVLASPSYGIPNAWLAMLATGALLQVWAQQLTVLLLAGHRSRLLLATRTLLGILGVPIAWFMTSAWGMVGAVLAYLTNSSLFLLAMGLMIGRLFGSAAKRLPA